MKTFKEILKEATRFETDKFYDPSDEIFDDAWDMLKENEDLWDDESFIDGLIEQMADKYDCPEGFVRSVVEGTIHSYRWRHKKVKEAISDSDKEIGVIELDMCFDESEQSWEDFQDENEFQDYGLEPEIIDPEGPGGGWPIVQLKGPKVSIRCWLADHYCEDEEDVKFYMSDFISEDNY